LCPPSAATIYRPAACGEMKIISVGWISVAEPAVADTVAKTRTVM